MVQLHPQALPPLRVITPTLGRASILNTYTQLLSQLGPKDGAIVIGDGIVPPLPPDSRVWIGFTSQTKNSGNSQRDAALNFVRGVVVFLDDDDTLLPGALDAVRAAHTALPGMAHLFRIRSTTGEYLPLDNSLKLGTVGGPCLTVRNDNGSLPRWADSHDAYTADYRYIKAWTALVPAVWHPEVIQEFSTHRGCIDESTRLYTLRIPSV